MDEDAYELEVLLGLRERARGEAEEALAAAHRAVAQARSAVAEARQALEDARAERTRVTTRFDQRAALGAARPAELSAFGLYVRGLEEDEQRLGEAIEEARTRQRMREAEAQQAQATLRAAITQVQAVEAHKAQWQEERAAQARRTQSAAMDEIAARRWREQHS